MVQKDTCTPMFIAALFVTAKTWKQPEHPLTEDWMKKMCNIYTMEYYLTISKNGITPCATTWVDLPTIILSEVKEETLYYIP